MRFLLSQPFFAFDLETTGVDVETDRVVTASVVKLTPYHDQGWKTLPASWLVNPAIPIPQGATDVHGITTETARANGMDPVVALDQVATALAERWLAKVPMVGCNVAYDLTLLDRELRRHQLLPVADRLGGWPVGPCIDVQVVDKWVDPYRKGSRKLTNMCGHYGVRIEGAHSADQDAVAAARVAFRMAQLSAGQRPVCTMSTRVALYPEVEDSFAVLGRLGAAELHTQQVRWRAEQQSSLAAHFRREGKPVDDICGDWPMRPFPGP